MPEYLVRGVPVQFPYDAYDQQVMGANASAVSSWRQICTRTLHLSVPFFVAAPLDQTPVAARPCSLFTYVSSHHQLSDRMPSGLNGGFPFVLSARHLC